MASCINQELSGGNVHPVCTMRIPNQLLLEWNYTDNTITFVSKANDHVGIYNYHSQTHRAAGETTGSAS